MSKRKFLACIAFGWLGAAAIVNAPHAHAEPVGDTGPFSGPSGDRSAAAMWTDTNEFFDGGATQAEVEQFGTAVCNALAGGKSEGEIIAALASDDSSKTSGLRYVVHAAEWHYCPSDY